MLHTVRLVTKSDYAARQQLHKKGRWGSKAQIAYSRSLNEAIMAKTNVDLDYLKNITAFADRVAMEMTGRLVEEGSKKEQGYVATVESGRRFDKVRVGVVVGTKLTMKEMETRYFVDRETGTIYGKKSDVAAQEKWFFGTLDEVDKWDWSGHHGVPKDFDTEQFERCGITVSEGAQVAAVGRYGKYYHFEPLTEAHRKALAAAEKQAAKAGAVMATA
jgi:hypothetical protein